MGARQRNAKKGSAAKAANHQQKKREGISVLDAGVDWITCTSKDLLMRSQSQELAVALIHLQSERGEKVTPWSSDGYTGLQCGEAGFGERDEDTLVRLSGPTAHSYWRRVYELSSNCSRIDVQVTLRGVEDVPELIQEHFESVSDHFAGWLRKPAIDLWKSNRGSDTLYINKRISEQFGRIYDKGVESKLDHYKSCVRYEVEYKGKSAKLVASKLAESNDVQLRAIELCQGFFADRGICAPGLRIHGHIISVPRSRSNASRCLRWLGAAVRPPVARLIQCGMLAECLEALGLTEYVLINESVVHGPPKKGTEQ